MLARLKYLLHAPLTASLSNSSLAHGRVDSTHGM